VKHSAVVGLAEEPIHVDIKLAVKMASIDVDKKVAVKMASDKYGVALQQRQDE
jgi:hypothetical protein